MSSLSYAHQKYFEALNSLVGAGSIQSRLAYARKYLFDLDVHECQADGAFEPFSSRHEGIMHQLNLNHRPNDEANPYGVINVGDDGGERITQEILGVFVDLGGGLRTK